MDNTCFFAIVVVWIIIDYMIYVYIMHVYTTLFIVAFICMHAIEFIQKYDYCCCLDSGILLPPRLVGDVTYELCPDLISGHVVSII